jgi:hypothetical protein
MDFVDEIHLETPTTGRVLHVFQQFAGFIDLGAGGGVYFDQIHEAPGVDLQAGGTLTAGRGRYADFAVQRFGENPGDGCFADSTGAGEQEGVVQALPVEGVGQGANDMLLTDQFMERARPPFAGQNLVAHKTLCMDT